MISLDQVQLLEHKVETAVAKIAELQKENDFLRNKFSELKVQYDELQKTNVEHSAKLSLYEQNQPRIEEGIMKALERLNNVEDSVLRGTSLSEESEGASPSSAHAEVAAEQNPYAQSASPAPSFAAPAQAQPQAATAPSFTAQPVAAPKLGQNGLQKPENQQLDIF